MCVCVCVCVCVRERERETVGTLIHRDAAFGGLSKSGCTHRQKPFPQVLFLKSAVDSQILKAIMCKVGLHKYI